MSNSSNLILKNINLKKDKSNREKKYKKPEITQVIFKSKILHREKNYKV